MDSSENNSYMLEVAGSNSSLAKDADDDDEDFDGSFNDVMSIPTSVCGQTSCFNGGRCDPVSQRCKCKVPHAGTYLIEQAASN
jgi:hypothetical protein